MELIRISNTLNLWPWLWLRGAGFPSSLVLELAAPNAAARLSDLISAEKARDDALGALVQAAQAAIEERTGKERKPFAKLLRKAKKGTLPAYSDVLGEIQEAYQHAEARVTEAGRAAAAYAEAFEGDRISVYEKLRDVSVSPQFREAVAWQNPHGLRTGIDKLASSDAGKYQRLVANYLQRYCAKNDQIGFFGPIGWGRVVDEEAAVRPGAELVSKREVHFSYWAIAALAESLSEEFALKPHLAPRLVPSARVTGSVLHYGIGRQSSLPASVAWVLSRADGSTTAADLAQGAIDSGATDFEDPDEIFELLEGMQEKGVLYWQIEIPPLAPYPEVTLRNALEAAGEAGARGREALAKLEGARQDLANAAGNPEAVAKAHLAVTETFHEVTQAEGTRNAGAAYGARTPVYEDCVRDAEVALPSAVFASIGPALELLTEGARWCSWDVAQRYRALFDQAFDALGGTRLHMPVFYNAIADAMPTMFGEGGGLVAESLALMRARWKELLAYDPAASRVQLRSSDLRDRVMRAFAAPGPGWPGARFHCPDLLFANPEGPLCESAEDAVVVLGEMHATTFSVFANCGAHGWPDLGSAIAAYERDSPIHIEPVIPKGLADRASGYSMSSRDMHLELGEALSMRDRSQVLRASELFVSRRDTTLVIHTENDEHVFDVVAFFEYTLGHAIGSRFGILEDARHSPRIRIDNLVVARESWAFEISELPFAGLPRGPEQFAEMARFRARHGLPRWVFAKASRERKPTYVDLDSPILVEILCNQLRSSSHVRFSEMLPSSGQAWLEDARGERYVSELRTVVVDDRPWQPPG